MKNKLIDLWKKGSAIKAAAIYMVGTFFVQGVNYLTLPIFANLMSTHDFGMYSSYENWVSIITIFLGIQTAASVINAYNDFSENKIKEYVINVSIVGWLTFGVILIFTSLFHSYLENIFELDLKILIFGIIQCLFVYFLNLILNEYRVLNKPVGYLFFSAGNTLMGVLLGIIFVVASPFESYKARILGTLVTSLIIGIIVLFTMYRACKPVINIKYMKYAVVLCLPLIFHSLAGVVMGKMDQMMLLKMMSASDMGIYSYGNKLGHVVFVLYTAANQAYIPWYYKIKKINEEELIIKVNKIYINCFTGLVAAILFVLPEIIKLLSPKEYYAAIYTAPFIIVGFYYNFLYTFPSNHEFYNKKTSYIAIGTIMSAIINIILNAVLIPRYGGVGAAFATCVSYVFLLLFHLFIAKYVIKNYEMKFTFFIKRSLIIFLILLLYFVCVGYALLRWVTAVLFIGILVKYFINFNFFKK